MGNCLVTKLKESVDNPSLLKIDEVMFHNVGSGNFTIRVNSNTGPSVATIIGDGYFDESGTHTTSHEFTNTIVSVPFVGDGNANIKCSNKGNINYLNAQGLNFADLKYLTELATLYGANHYGDIANIHLTKIKSLTTSGSGVYGDLAMLPTGGTQWQIRITNVTCSNLGAFVAGTKDQADVVILLSTNPLVTGSIESVVSACVDAGRTNKTIIFSIFRTGITFGGTTDAANTPEPTSYSPRLKWTDKTHITLQFGIDADVEDTSKNIPIFAKGATAGQISTWESQGNTVHVVS